MDLAYADIQDAYSVMISTNQSATEILRTRLCVIQILRNISKLTQIISS